MARTSDGAWTVGGAGGAEGDGEGAWTEEEKRARWVEEAGWWLGWAEAGAALSARGGRAFVPAPGGRVSLWQAWLRAAPHQAAQWWMHAARAVAWLQERERPAWVWVANTGAVWLEGGAPRVGVDEAFAFPWRWGRLEGRGRAAAFPRARWWTGAPWPGGLTQARLSGAAGGPRAWDWVRWWAQLEEAAAGGQRSARAVLRAREALRARAGGPGGGEWDLATWEAAWADWADAVDWPAHQSAPPLGAPPGAGVSLPLPLPRPSAPLSRAQSFAKDRWVDGASCGDDLSGG